MQNNLFNTHFKTDKMKRLSLLIIGALAGFSWIFGQNKTNYPELINEAWKLYESKEYLKSGQRYSEAFQALNGKGIVEDRYNAACSWALANKPDSAFTQLFKIAQNGNFSKLEHILKNTDLNSLHQDNRWLKIIETVKTNKDKTEANLNKVLVSLLDTVYLEDQKYRLQTEEIESEYGWESDKMETHLKTINLKDSINLIKVKKILDEYGWLGADIIGNQGNTTLFLVIQHSDIETQQTYLPMMREAVKNRNATARNLALLEDRVSLRKGKKQIYGSQIGRDTETGEYYILPLIDPENVDKRRAEIGLESIQDYISNWKIVWDVDAYKKKLPEYQSKQNR